MIWNNNRPDSAGFFTDVSKDCYEQLWLNRECRLQRQNALTWYSTKHSPSTHA